MPHCRNTASEEPEVQEYKRDKYSIRYRDAERQKEIQSEHQNLRGVLVQEYRIMKGIK